MEILYIIGIRDEKNESLFNEYILTSTTNLAAAEEIIKALTECLDSRYVAFWQKQFIEN